jgi:hypothetical protein
MTDRDAESWDAEFRPRAMRRAAIVTSAVIAVAGVVVATLDNHSSGAYMRVWDQIAWGGLALLIAAGVLLLTRPRVRIGPSGLSVRNLLEDKLIAWKDVVDVSFPPKRRWARVDLDSNEYVPVVAIQLVDKEYAVEAMDTVREAMARYRAGTSG